MANYPNSNYLDAQLFCDETLAQPTNEDSIGIKSSSISRRNADCETNSCISDDSDVLVDDIQPMHQHNGSSSTINTNSVSYRGFYTNTQKTEGNKNTNSQKIDEVSNSRANSNICSRNAMSEFNNDQVQECLICCTNQPLKTCYTVPRCSKCVHAVCCDQCVSKLVRMCFTGYDYKCGDYLHDGTRNTIVGAFDIEVVEQFCYYMCPYCRTKIILYDSVIQRSCLNKCMNIPGLRWLHSVANTWGDIQGQSPDLSWGFHVAWKITCETPHHLCFHLEWGTYCDECKGVHSPREVDCIIRIPRVPVSPIPASKSKPLMLDV